MITTSNRANPYDNNYNSLNRSSTNQPASQQDPESIRSKYRNNLRSTVGAPVIPKPDYSSSSTTTPYQYNSRYSPSKTNNDPIQPYQDPYATVPPSRPQNYDYPQTYISPKPIINPPDLTYQYPKYFPTSSLADTQPVRKDSPGYDDIPRYANDYKPLQSYPEALTPSQQPSVPKNDFPYPTYTSSPSIKKFIPPPPSSQPQPQSQAQAQPQPQPYFDDQYPRQEQVKRQQNLENKMLTMSYTELYNSKKVTKTEQSVPAPAPAPTTPVYEPLPQSNYEIASKKQEPVYDIYETTPLEEQEYNVCSIF